MKHTPLTLFIADDDEDDILLFKETLNQVDIGGTLIIFRNGKEVCDHIQKSILLPDIIFLDINMPIMNGKDCLKAIRKNPAFNDVPIIIYSTSTFPDDIEETQKDGANLYMPKPYSFRIQESMFKEVFKLFYANKLMNIPKSKYLFKHIV